MIPLKDENPTKTFPFFTVSIIIINIAVFLYELSLQDNLASAIKYFGATPYAITHPADSAVFATLITSLFFHGSIMHLLGNMLYLWVFGNNIEDRLGHTRFLFFYLACGVIATLGYIVTAPLGRLPLVGASGAISAVLGAYLLLYPRAKVLVLIPFLFIWRVVKIPAFFFLGFWIIMQLFSGARNAIAMNATEQGGIAWFAHIFGFAAGIALLMFLLPGKRPRLRL